MRLLNYFLDSKQGHFDKIAQHALMALPIRLPIQPLFLLEGKRYMLLFCQGQDHLQARIPLSALKADLLNPAWFGSEGFLNRMNTVNKRHRICTMNMAGYFKLGAPPNSQTGFLARESAQDSLEPLTAGHNPAQQF